MSEERVTINILEWLEGNSFQIVCYDFPQSGTGILLHQNFEGTRISKNKGSIIPDIIAVKNNYAVFFENKDRFVLSDFEKIKNIKRTGNYSIALQKLLSIYSIVNIFFGIGIPYTNYDIKKSLENMEDIDFLISTDEKKNVYVHYDFNKIFS